MSKAKFSPRRGSEPDSGFAQECNRQTVAEHLDAGHAARDEDSSVGRERAAIDQYRYVYATLRSASLPQPAPSFAREMEQLTRDHPEKAKMEIWIMGWLLALSCCAMALVFSSVWDAAAPRLLVDQLRPLPWPLLAAVGTGLLAVWLADWWQSGSRHH